MAELEQALYARLAGFGGLAALTSTRIYPLRAPQNPTLPYVTYQRVSGERFSAMGDDTGIAHALMQVDAWASTYLSARAVATQIRHALQRWRDSASNPEVLDVFVERDQDMDPEEFGVPDLYRVSTDFRIYYREGVA